MLLLAHINSICTLLIGDGLGPAVCYEETAADNFFRSVVEDLLISFSHPSESHPVQPMFLLSCHRRIASTHKSVAALSIISKVVASINNPTLASSKPTDTLSEAYFRMECPTQVPCCAAVGIMHKLLSYPYPL